VHVGLNDLALSLGVADRFALLADPLLDHVARRVHAAGLPLGLAGIGRVGLRGLPVDGDLVLAALARLGARATILARSFVGGADEAVDLGVEVARARERLAHWALAGPEAHAAAAAALPAGR
jgi:hypothetical protein